MTEPTPGGWNPCPPGELARLAAELTFRRRLRALARAGLVVVAVAAMVGATRVAYPSLWASPAPSDPAPCHGCDEPPAPCNHEDPPAASKK